MPISEIQKGNRNKLDFNPIEANPIKQEQQAQTCQTQELQKQSKIDKVIEEQSVLSQVTRKPKLKTDALPNTNKQIIRPKFNHLPLQSINFIYLDQIWPQVFKIWRIILHALTYSWFLTSQWPRSSTNCTTVFSCKSAQFERPKVYLMYPYCPWTFDCRLTYFDTYILNLFVYKIMVKQCCNSLEQNINLGFIFWGRGTESNVQWSMWSFRKCLQNETRSTSLCINLLRILMWSIKLPPYFKQYSKGIEVAFQTAKFIPVNFCIWKSFGLQTLSSHQEVNLKKLSPVPEFPINDLKSKIAQLKSIPESKGNKSWLHAVGGGIGSGLLLIVIMVSVCVYWRYKKYSQNDARSTNLSGNPTDSVNLNMMHTRKGATRTDDTVLGQEAVWIQVLGEHYKKVSVKNPVHGSEASGLLRQLGRVRHRCQWTSQEAEDQAVWCTTQYWVLNSSHWNHQAQPVAGTFKAN